MTFDQIAALANIEKKEKSDMEKIRHQRQLCSEILAGFLFSGKDLSESEHYFVTECNRAMRPLTWIQLSVLQMMNDRRWGK